MCNILSKDNFQELQSKVNALICPVCGKNHHVKLRVLNDIIFYDVSTNWCPGFDEYLKKELKIFVRQLFINPIPLIK